MNFEILDNKQLLEIITQKEIQIQALTQENKKDKQTIAEVRLTLSHTQSALHNLQNQILSINPLAEMLVCQTQELSTEELADTPQQQRLLQGAWVESLLLQTEIRLAIAEDVTKMGIWDWNALTNETYYSANYYRILGYEVDEFTPSYEKWIEIIHPEDRERAIETQKNCMQSPDFNYDLELRMYHKKLGYQWFWARGSVVERDENAQAKRLIGICLNIDEKKKIEDALQQSEKEFMEIIEDNSAAIYIYDKEGFVYVNYEFTKIFGYTLEESKNLMIYDLIHPDVSHQTAVLLNNFNKKPTKKLRFDIRSCTKRGTPLWIDISLVASHYQGREIRIASIYDITSRKAAEEELKHTIEELRTIEEELRQNSEELVAINDYLQQTKEKLEQTLAQEQASIVKIELKNKQLYEQKTKLKRTLNELKKTQEQLIQSEKMASVGVLVAGIAHELNNPINYISNSSEALRSIVGDIILLLKKFDELNANNIEQKIKEVEKIKKEIGYEYLIQDIEDLVNNIGFGADQTAEIVRGLRTFTRFDGGQKEQVFIPWLIDSTLIVLHNQYKDVVEIEKQYAPDLPEITGYPSKINQVLMNLLSNAIFAVVQKFPQSGGKINISVELNTQKLGQKAVLVSIKDNGIGIPENIKKRIFEPFFTNKEVGKGTGLGLSISLNIIENHQGKVEFISQEGEGTTFFIYLPIKIDE